MQASQVNKIFTNKYNLTTAVPVHASSGPRYSVCKIPSRFLGRGSVHLPLDTVKLFSEAAPVLAVVGVDFLPLALLTHNILFC